MNTRIKKVITHCGYRAMVQESISLKDVGVVQKYGKLVGPCLPARHEVVAYMEKKHPGTNFRVVPIKLDSTPIAVFEAREKPVSVGTHR